jgi:hypothetical protein
VLVEDRCKKSDTPFVFGFGKTRGVTKIFLCVLSGPPTNPSRLHCARTTINDRRGMARDEQPPPDLTLNEGLRD